MSKRERGEPSAEQAENWVHVNPRPKAKVNNNNLKHAFYKNSSVVTNDSVKGKAPMSHDNQHADCVVSAIFSSFVVVSIAPVLVNAAGKQKNLEYAGCDISAMNMVCSDNNIVATTTSNDVNLSMPSLSPPLSTN